MFGIGENKKRIKELENQLKTLNEGFEESKKFLKNLETDSEKETTENINPEVSDFYLGNYSEYLEGRKEKATSSNQLELWRRLSVNNLDVQYAVEQIVNDVVLCDGVTAPIKLDFLLQENETDIQESTREKITEEWEHLSTKVLKLHKNIYNHFKSWYIDGCLFFENIYEKDKINNGVYKIKMLNPLGLIFGKKQFTIQKSNETITKNVWYYDLGSSQSTGNMNGSGFLNIFSNVYNSGLGSSFTPTDKNSYYDIEQISYSTTDLYDFDSGCFLSYLNYAVRPLNQLFAIENAFVVFALTRSTDKLVYYIDVGQLPEPKVKAKIQEIIRDNSTKGYYNSNSGSVADAPDKIKLTNEIYLARRNGTKGTEISSLSATSINLGETSILNYLKDNLDKALMLPKSRRAKDKRVSLDFASEIDNDEMIFYKYVVKLRKLFVAIYKDVLGKHLISKNILTEEEWEENEDAILFKFNETLDVQKTKYLNDLKGKLDAISYLEQYVKTENGEELKLFVVEDILKNILGYTEQEIEEWKKKISKVKSANDGDGMGDDGDYEDDIDNAFDEIGQENEQMQEESNQTPSSLNLAGDVHFKDIEQVKDFAEFLKEEDELVFKFANGKTTKHKVRDLKNGK